MKNPGAIRIFAVFGFLVSGSGAQAEANTVAGETRRAHHAVPHVAHDGQTGHGKASFYSQRLKGRKTASGEPYDPNAMTAAHRTLPLGTRVRVVNPKNDRSVVVTVNDRGPVPKDRTLDVSSAAAEALGMKKAGVTRVETEVVSRPESGGSGKR
jgi:rare lipoprotein A